MADNFEAKAQSRSEGAVFTPARLISTGVAFEAFRITVFRNAGVAPKRYFGFLDGQGLAGHYETKMMAIASRLAPMLNAYARAKGKGVTVAAKEIVVTHIAEGAALLLSTDFAEIDQVHPVRGVGLDDYRKGLVQYADLVRDIDATFKTHLAAFSMAEPATAQKTWTEKTWAERLWGDQVKLMTFEESVLATGVMYLWEKSIAEEKSRAEGRPSLAALPLDAQYVTASLVYNSGILFSPERVKQIMDFDTSAYLVETSNKLAAKRPLLPVADSAEADAVLASGAPLPRQPTSWNAVYHILQRYGAWVALSRFSDDFTAEGDINNAP